MVDRQLAPLVVVIEFVGWAGELRMPVQGQWCESSAIILPYGDVKGARKHDCSPMSHQQQGGVLFQEASLSG